MPRISVGLHVLGVAPYWHAGTHRMYAFARGDDGHLYVHFWTGATWQWADQGVPTGATVATGPDVVTSVQVMGGAQQKLLYAFVGGTDGHLHVNYWDGSQWNWADQGAPGRAMVATASAVIAFRYGGTKRIYAFVGGTNGHLHVNYWDGSQWNWADQGAPGSAMVATAPGVVTFQYEGTDRIYVFVGGTDGRLYIHYWDGANWHWTDQGTRANVLVATAPAAVPFFYDGTNRLYSFMGGADGHLYIHYWDGAEWKWTDQDAPPNTRAATAPRVVAFRHEGSDRMYAFVGGSNGHLYIHYWDGARWHWTHQGTP